MLKWNKGKEMGACRIEEEKRISTEKGDYIAMLIAAWLTFLPAAIVTLGVMCLLFFFWFL